MGHYINGKNNLVILIVLLVIVGLVAWSAIRNNRENLTRNFSDNVGRRRGVDYVPEGMPVQAILEPELDYETIYGGANDNFGMGPGASDKTTNDLTLAY